MSSGKKLQEMEVGTKQSTGPVNANAAKGMPLEGEPNGSTPGQTGGYEDLGGPTPDNYKPDDDSAKLTTPGKTLKQVKDVVNKGAKSGMPMQKEEEEMDTEATLEESPEVTDEVVEEDAVAEVEETIVEYDMEEDVNALLGGEELSEDFKAKAKTIFEAAINSKVTSIKESLEEEYAGKLAEQVEESKAELSERVDSYLEYVADEWFEENSLAIENGLKTEMTESFLEGMKSLFEEHYVSIPEDKYDVLESMVEKLDDMETKLNEQIEKNIGLNKRLAESVAGGILESVSDGLAATQKEKLASLAESVEFESEVEYREKLETLKESYFHSKPNSPQAKSETLSEGVDIAPEVASGTMAGYLQTLSQISK